MQNIIFSTFIQNYNPNSWGGNGPDILTKVLKSICNVNYTSEMTRENCDGFKVYDINEFFAISYYIFRDAFERSPDKISSIMKIIKNSTLVHMSNNLSKGFMIEKGTSTAYGILGSTYCPKVYVACRKYF